ncbi:MAG: membrane protein insertion efficiency factor YidD [Syntrophus sp. (in: bacteria)]|nr:membrane protein insertion efficiency factor YidD [Syntrophus sp. (in: bacteria)]
MERYEGRAPTIIIKRENAVVKNILIHLLNIYRILISPYIPTQCRFHPTCSCYMKEAIEKKGISKGVALGLVRILKCNPLHPGGYDPVK